MSRRARRYGLEKDVQVRCAHIWASFGFTVYWLSQARATQQTPGLPDLYLLHPVHGGVWHEVKRAKAKVSAAQLEFERLCALSGTHYVRGDTEAVWAFLGGRGLTPPPQVAFVTAAEVILARHEGKIP